MTDGVRTGLCPVCKHSDVRGSILSLTKYNSNFSPYNYEIFRRYYTTTCHLVYDAHLDRRAINHGGSSLPYITTLERHKGANCWHTLSNSFIFYTHPFLIDKLIYSSFPTSLRNGPCIALLLVSSIKSPLCSQTKLCFTISFFGTKFICWHSPCELLTILYLSFSLLC